MILYMCPIDLVSMDIPVHVQYHATMLINTTTHTQVHDEERFSLAWMHHRLYTLHFSLSLLKWRGEYWMHDLHAVDFFTRVVGIEVVARLNVGVRQLQSGRLCVQRLQSVEAGRGKVQARITGRLIFR